MEGNFTKIIIVSLCDIFSKDIGKTLSQNLDMIFCDTKDLIEYELIDKKAIEKFCTVEYLEYAEASVIRHISTFVNVVVSISFDYLIHSLNILKEGSLIVFVKLPKTYIKQCGEAVNEIAYQSRTKELEKLATVTVDVKKTDVNFVCEKILNALGGII